MFFTFSNFHLVELNAQVSFTFHFSLFINTSIHYFKGSLSARFRSPSDLCQRFGLQFLPMHPRQGNHHL